MEQEGIKGKERGEERVIELGMKGRRGLNKERK